MQAHPDLKEEVQDLGCFPVTPDAFLMSPPHIVALSRYCVLPTNKNSVFDRRRGLAGLATGCGYSHAPRNKHLVPYPERDTLLDQPHERQVAGIRQFFQFHATQE